MKISKQIFGSLFLAVLSGVAWLMACPPWPCWWMAWGAMLPLFFAVKGIGGHRAFVLGWTAGLVGMLGAFAWFPGLLITFGTFPASAAWLVHLLYSIYQALIFAIFTWSYTYFRDRLPIPVWILAPMILVSIESLFPLIFPWYLAITQAFVPTTIQIVEFTGPQGVTFLLVMSAAVVYDIVVHWLNKRRFAWHALIPIFVLTAVIAWSRQAINDVQENIDKAIHLEAAVIEPDIPFMRGDAELKTKLMITLQAMSRKVESLVAEGELPKIDLILWPESSLPYPLPRHHSSDYATIVELGHPSRIKRGFTTPLLLGALTYEDLSDWRRIYYSSALLIDRSDSISIYDKCHPLFFSEYFPLYDSLESLQTFFQSHGFIHLHKGKGPSLLKLKIAPPNHGAVTIRMAPLICYEDILLSYSRNVARQQPNFLVNVTNDAWFGATQEPYQHLALAALMSAATRLPMLRAVNRGVSALILPNGRIDMPSVPDCLSLYSRRDSNGGEIKPKPMDLPNAQFYLAMRSSRLGNRSRILHFSVPLVDTTPTFYVKHGNLFAWCCEVVLLGLVWACCIKKSK
jgi:apolipoprotein N-acyltransferase